MRGPRGAAHAAISLRWSVKYYRYAFMRIIKLSIVLLSKGLDPPLHQSV